MYNRWAWQLKEKVEMDKLRTQNFWTYWTYHLKMSYFPNYIVRFILKYLRNIIFLGLNDEMLPNITPMALLSL